MTERELSLTQQTHSLMERQVRVANAQAEKVAGKQLAHR
jgi:hypothetical protein